MKCQRCEAEVKRLFYENLCSVCSRPPFSASIGHRVIVRDGMGLTYVAFGSVTATKQEENGSMSYKVCGRFWSGKWIFCADCEPGKVCDQCHGDHRSAVPEVKDKTKSDEE